MFPNCDWTVELPQMLSRQDPESLHLDYKARDSLLPRGRGGGGIDRQKRAEDVSKDVSSFLNSDGDTLVYGVREQEDPRSGILFGPDQWGKPGDRENHVRPVENPQ